MSYLRKSGYKMLNANKNDNARCAKRLTRSNLIHQLLRGIVRFLRIYSSFQFLHSSFSDPHFCFIAVLCLLFCGMEFSGMSKKI